MIYVTHKRSDGTYQTLKEHSEGVADKAACFAECFDAAAHAYRIGLLHDIGKYSRSGQLRQLDPVHTVKVDHATAGAVMALQLYDRHAPFVIAGHHGGLQDPGSARSSDSGTLMARLQKNLTGDMDATAWKEELHVDAGCLAPRWLQNVSGKNVGFVNAMYTRMLFSCLVDGDYLDTEAFMSDVPIIRGIGEGLDTLLYKLRKHVAPWLQGEPKGINAIRTRLLHECLNGDKREQGIYTLTIPTGGGKTISSLAFALSHAVKHGMTRVIYVVPYISIIEQNAQVFREILGEDNVLEHHANVNLDEEEGVHRLAAENWDAPVVVTTAVQFFESLFSARTSQCRKLHNIANAVVIFDEAQMLPLPYLMPCVHAIAELVQHYRVTAVLCTATQPALDRLITQYAPSLIPAEICPDTDTLFDSLRRTRIQRDGLLSTAELASRLSGAEQVLCIVNLRCTAQELFAALPAEGRYHLSTLMTPEHRTQKLKEIRNRLREGLTCRVVSSSLIEAGVDVDFPCVWRELAGLDSILQAAGRCNREGRHPVEESLVHVFQRPEGVPRMIRQNALATEKVMKDFVDIASPQAISAYFRELLFIKGEEALDVKNILSLSEGQQFRTIAKEFCLIEEETVPIFIPTQENDKLLSRLRAGEISRELLRKLGKYTVSVHQNQLDSLAGAVEMLPGLSCGILLHEEKYDADCGLILAGTIRGV